MRGMTAASPSLPFSLFKPFLHHVTRVQRIRTLLLRTCMYVRKEMRKKERDRSLVVRIDTTNIPYIVYSTRTVVLHGPCGDSYCVSIFTCNRQDND